MTKMMKPFPFEVITAVLLACMNVGSGDELPLGPRVMQVESPPPVGKAIPEKAGKEAANKDQELEIHKLIEQLVFYPFPMPQGPLVPLVIPEPAPEDPFSGLPPTSPQFEVEEVPPGIARENAKSAKACRVAFHRLLSLGALAVPSMVEHLEDGRPSLDFNGHWKTSTLGDACYWNLREGLQDLPEDYSSYGYARKGRDGENHVTPYWIYPGLLPKEGLKAWLTKNATLSYTEKQIKCLKWYLAEEKKIGASDPRDYFVNILPLEIRILQKRSQLGEDVEKDLKQRLKIQKDKQESAVPPELLPAQPKKESELKGG